MCPFAECRHDGQTTKRADDAVVKTRGKKRTQSDVEHDSNECDSGDVSASKAATHDDVHGTASDDGTDAGDVENSPQVCGSSEDARTEMTRNLQSDAIDTNAPAALTTQEIDIFRVDPLSIEVLRNSDSPSADVVGLTASINKTTDDVTMTSSSELPLPVVTSTSYWQGPRSLASYCCDVPVVNTQSDDKTAGDITVTPSKLLPVASLSTSTAGPLSRAPTPSRVGRIVHSAARLFPFPVPMTISQQAPTVVGGSTLTLRPSILPLGTPRWLSVPHAAPSPQCLPLRLISPTVIFTDCFQKQHATGCRGLRLPQIGYYGATPGDYRGPSDFRVCAAPQQNSVEVPAASQQLTHLSRSSFVDLPQSSSTCETRQQASADSKSEASADDVLAKLDPVSRAVYDNFLGKLRTTTKLKNGNGRRRGHMNDATRRYRN